MQTRKAALALALAAVPLAAAAGCGSSNDSSSGSSGSGSKQTSVVYVPGLTGNPFYTTVGCGATEQAKASNVKFSVQGAPDGTYSLCPVRLGDMLLPPCNWADEPRRALGSYSPLMAMIRSGLRLSGRLWHWCSSSKPSITGMRRSVSNTSNLLVSR